MSSAWCPLLGVLSTCVYHHRLVGSPIGIFDDVFMGMCGCASLLSDAYLAYLAYLAYKVSISNRTRASSAINLRGSTLADALGVPITELLRDNESSDVQERVRLLLDPLGPMELDRVLRVLTELLR